MITFISKILRDSLSLIKGLWITGKNLITPAVTLQYPDQKDKMTDRYRGLVDLIPEKCIACYQCVKICPTGCLALTHRQTLENKKVLVTFDYDMERCCFCGLCEQACPTAAMFMNKIYEISTTSRDKLHINLMDPEKYCEWNHSVSK